MSILVNNKTKLVVQGITGREGSFHAIRCKNYGTNLVAGVTPGQGGNKFDETVSIFDTVEEAVRMTGANTSLIFVPPPFAIEAISESIDSGIEVIAFNNLLVDLADSLNAQILIRGLRAVSDFEYEFQMLGMNRQLNSKIETVFLMADAQRQSISSNFIKDIARLNGDISNFTNDFVSNKLKEKFKWT